MKTKTKEEMLASYKRANKKARIGIWIRSQFDNEEDYLKYLTSKKPIALNLAQAIKDVKKRFGDKPIIHNVHILDASGSMRGPKFNNALLGINEEIEELKTNNEINFTQTIVKFSSRGTIKCDFYKIPMNLMYYFNESASGQTALYDAIEYTLNKLLDDYKPNEKILVKIFTDGEENDSRVNKRYVNDLIKSCEAKGFIITFVGTEFDTRNIIKDLGINVSNTLIHDNTAMGIKMSFRSSAVATKSYGQAVLDGASDEELLTGFYKREGTL